MDVINELVSDGLWWNKAGVLESNLEPGLLGKVVLGLWGIWA